MSLVSQCADSLSVVSQSVRGQNLRVVSESMRGQSLSIVNRVASMVLSTEFVTGSTLYGHAESVPPLTWKLTVRVCRHCCPVQHLCNDRLAVRVCPSTCGLCSLYNTTICQDMLAHAGCHSLVLTDNICSDSNVARDICPRTCGMCGEFHSRCLPDSKYS